MSEYFLLNMTIEKKTKLTYPAKQSQISKYKI